MTRTEFDSNSYRDANGVYRWKSNDRVPFDDMLQSVGVDAECRAKCKAARSADNDAFFAEYRANYKGPSAEERAEARAAHGPGVTLVNVITGHKWTT
jgi:hypothetical protein